MLVTRPNHDVTTNYLFYWSLQLIGIATRKGVTVYDLVGDKSNRARVESYMRKKSPSLVFLNGHGAENVVTGHNDSPLISSVDTSLSLYSGSVVYARSCRSGVGLGPALVASGATAYIGYTDDFIFFRRDDFTTTPLRDPVAKYFLEPSNLIVSTLLKGKTTREAQKRSKKAMYKNLGKMLSSDAGIDERNMAPFLWSNINSQTLIGSVEAKLR